MKIALYPGTFNPFHYGHLEFAQAETKNFDKVIFLPSGISPNKLTTLKTPGKIRYEWIRKSLAFKPFDPTGKIEVSDFEAKQSRPTYFIDSLHHFQTLYPNAELHLLGGEETRDDIPNWRCHEEILQILSGIHCRKRRQPNGMPTQTLELSSTLIREYIQKGIPVDQLVPIPIISNVEEYFQKEAAEV